ncbi:MAG: carboxypeptidase-like regulatory domain-containing protein, partial [Pirellulales bacterium]|nr:carboxypeptidase-like regulatory domain-containing protein [Pirellulales bacterium]
VSDKLGRYQVTGLPLEGTLRITALNPGDLPYLDARIQQNVSATTAPKPIDFKLDRGVRIRGRVTDRNTGKRVVGNVGYLSWPNNEQLGNLHQDFDTFNSMGTDAEGNFVLIVPPGPGVLAFQARNGAKYSPASGQDFGFPIRNGGMFSSGNRGLVAAEEFHFVKRIEPAPGQTDLQVDIHLGRGDVLAVEVIKADGGSFEEILAYDVVPRRRSGYRAGRFDVFNLQPDQTRTVFLHDPSLDYAGVFELKMPARKGDRNVQLKLEKASTVSGRLTDVQGRPLSRWFVVATSSGMVDWITSQRSGLRPTGMFNFHQTSTDADGYFRLKGLPAGTPIELAAGARRDDQRPIPKRIKTLSLRPGRNEELGPLQVRD